MQTDIAPPDGFVPHDRRSPLTEPWEPIFVRRTEEAVILGLQARPAHANGRGFVHGGLLMALADNAMGLTCAHRVGGDRSLVTVNLSLDFLAATAHSRRAQQPPRPRLARRGRGGAARL